MPKGLENKEVRQTTTAQDIYTSAVNNKQFMDTAIRVAIEGAQKNVGKTTFTCYMCGKLKSRDEFMKSTDSNCITGVTRICKECAKKIAYHEIDGSEKSEPTEESIREMCSYLDYPWLYTIYGSALKGAEENKTQDIVDLYEICLIANDTYYGLTFKDSEVISETERIRIENSSVNTLEQEYAYNRKDVIRFAGYDPYANYPIEEDKPRLYAQLISLMDEETKNDGMKMGAVLQIVKNLNQAQKLSDQMDLLVNDSKNVAKNMAIIDRMSGAAKKLLDAANDLAKSNGIAINFNNNKSAGGSTLSGKMKKLNEIGFRNAAINTFDIGTCSGMRQVAEISEEARHKRLGYDENIASEIKDIKIELVEQAQRERDESREFARKLLLENKDLKQYLKDKGLLDDEGRVIDNV